MLNAKTIISRVGIVLFVGFFLYMGLKSLVGTIWQPPPQTTTYAVRGADGRSLVFIFLPEHTTFIAYADSENGQVEQLATKMGGSYGTHYFWRVWNVEGPGIGEGLFGYRIFPEGAEPVVMETTIFDKYVQGTGDPTLPQKGDRMHPVILFKDRAIRFEGMWLQEEPTDPQFLRRMTNRFGGETR